MIASQTPALSGILVALATPFTDDGCSIHEARLQAHIDRLINAGIHGLVPGGSTGEFTAMDLAERKQLLELVIRFTDGRVPVVAGVGTLTTKDTIDLAQHAASVGAAAIMVVPPFYDAPNYEQIQELLRDVHHASGLDIMYYHIPSASGVKLSAEQLAGLSSCGAKYLKDTSGDAVSYTELIFRHGDAITAFNGWDTLTFNSLAAGAKGAVWGASNIVPELSVELWNTVAVRGDLKKGRELWKLIWPICKFLESHNYSSAVKTGLELLGQETGGLRKPFKLLEDGPKKELAGLLQSAGLKLA